VLQSSLCRCDFLYFRDLLYSQIEEMLSLFSTSPDKSISFDDFTRVMILAKLAWYASVCHCYVFS
jgi:hypothetical protein